MSGVREPHIEESLINLTPLIDVVFVVLIMFILVAPLLDIDRIALAEGPQKAEKINLREKPQIKLSVDSQDRIHLNGTLVSAKDLKRTLIRLHEAHPDETPKLFQDKKAHFGVYQTVKNAVEASGFAELDVVLSAQ